MKGAGAIAAALVAAWLGIGGLVYLGARGAVIEALCIELCAVVLAFLSAVLFAYDMRRSR